MLIIGNTAIIRYNLMKKTGGGFMQNIIFPKDFVWGAATASYQIEGGVKEDRRGESIWDTFCRIPGKIFNGHNGDVACDHFHRYKDDVKLMKELGLKAYRFSVAWPRVFPQGRGSVNLKGLEFYRRLTNELKENGIEPYVTLYHWDLPQALQDLGGWDRRDIADDFAEYSMMMYNSLGDIVKKWFTFNEPWCTSFLGYAYGVHAPGIVDPAAAVRASHNIMLSHAKAVEAYKGSKHNDGKVGIVLNIAPVYPKTDTDRDRLAAANYDGYCNRWFFDCCFLGRYPEDILKIYQNALKAPVIRNGDMELISSNRASILGVNYYTRTIVSSNLISDSFTGRILKFRECRPGGPVTEMGWEIYPQAFYDFLERVRTTYGNPETYITENGAAFPDKNIIDGMIDDADRIEYLKQHISTAYKAMRDGLDLRGYFVWSLMDNFEWAHGYSKLFGITHVDYGTQKRTFKKSALWYRELIRTNTLT